MSDRESTSIRLFLAQSARILARVRARAAAKAEAIRQETITNGFRAFYDWQRAIRIPTLWQRDPKNLRGRANWDKFRALAIPIVRHFNSYERKGIYEWRAGPANPTGRPRRRRHYDIEHSTRFTDQRWHPSIPFKDRYDRFLYFILEFYYNYTIPTVFAAGVAMRRAPADWLHRVALFPGIRWNGPTTLVGSRSNLTEDGRAVSNRQAASWARMKSAIRRMRLTQGLIDLI